MHLSIVGCRHAARVDEIVGLTLNYVDKVGGVAAQDRWVEG